MAGLATSGTLTHWFRDELARDLPDAAFERLAAEAAAVPAGADGLIVLPYFSGERTPIHDPNAKGVIFGLNLTHTRGHLYRAVLEGIACGTAHALEACAEAGAAPRRLLAVGGGVANEVWAQATSDFCELDQMVCAHQHRRELRRRLPRRGRHRRRGARRHRRMEPRGAPDRGAADRGAPAAARAVQAALRPDPRPDGRRCRYRRTHDGPVSGAIPARR